MNVARCVGVVGLGLIGTAASSRLLAAGMSVLGVDLDHAKGAALEELGGEAADSIGALRGTDAILLAVFDTTQVEAAVEAVLPADGQVVVCLSTVDPGRMEALAARAACRGIRLIEMQVSGSSGQLAAGEALGLVAGPAEAVEAVEDVLSAVCPQRAFLDRAGDGARVKLAINLILGLNRAALAEGLLFAERLGLNPTSFLLVARASAAASQVMDIKGPKMLAREYAPQGRVVQSAKDFSLIAAEAARVGIRLPMASLYAGLIDGCIAAGEGDWDNAAVIEELRRRLPAAN